ncbi:regulator of Ty1 transposition [Scheffersomyces xylosifermentans]|uniref:regulator of Ty1 transposition n=1 Tax=Scheffersomyces xylosifermentans TaxID=1304137 RepID=UPI00315D01B3
MSYSPYIFKSKLASLQDTQESIVSISQWVLFHHRRSADSAKFWASYINSIPSLSSSSSKSSPLSDPSLKKLSLLYLCNDVVQQARRKRKPEFITDFAAVLPSVLNQAYNTVDNATKPKIERLIGVWEQRQIFGASDIAKMKEAVKAPLLTKSRSSPDSSLVNNHSSTSPSRKSAKESIGAVAPELKSLNDLFLKLNSLTDITQANLTQFGIQSKTYLPNDPLLSDNLPSPKVYVSKLNMLEKLSEVSIANIKEVKDVKEQISKQLENLSRIIAEGTKTEESKIAIINEKLVRLHETRNELKEMIEEEEEGSNGDNKIKTKKVSIEEEDPSPSYETNDIESNGDSFVVEDDDNDDLPTYENDDDDDDKRVIASSEEETPLPKRRRLSQTPSGGSTPSSFKKVAFSEDIEVKEFDREEQTDIIKIVKSDDDTSDFDIDNDDIDSESAISEEFESHHKDDLELKHEHDNTTSVDEEEEDDDAYSPTPGNVESEDEDEAPGSSVDVMSLLSKLA